MLNSLARVRTRRGFSLIELLVGMAVGLVVVGSVVAFIASSIQANSENIRSIRLNQELRALTEIVAREVRRARYVRAQIGTIGATPPVVSPYNQIAVGVNCLQFSYEPVTVQTAGGGPATIASGRAFWRDTDNNRLMTAQGTVIAGTPVIGCNNGTALSSAEVRITGFTVTDPAAGPCAQGATAQANANCIVLDIGITGAIGPPNDVISRSFAQRVRVRSAVQPVTPPAPPPPPPPPPPP